MHIHMLLDNDAYVHDAYICDIQSLTMLHVCMMRLKFCDQQTNKAILGVGFEDPLNSINDNTNDILTHWKQHQVAMSETFESGKKADFTNY